MKATTRVLALCFVFVSTVSAQGNPFRGMEILTVHDRPPTYQRTSPQAQVKDLQTLDGQWGIVYTDDAIFRTTDGGTTWVELPLTIASQELLSSVRFSDPTNGYAILARPDASSLDLARTSDGGENWVRTSIELGDLRLHEPVVYGAELDLLTGLIVSIPIATSSNFAGRLRIASDDDGLTWRLVDKRVELRTSDEPKPKRSGAWSIATTGDCSGFKSGCIQETRIVRAGVDVTPSKIVELTNAAKQEAAHQAGPMFAAPPGGSSRTSLNQGFDKCTAGTILQMGIWWNSSPHYDANIYFSGRNRACSQAQLTPAWVDQVTAMGWGLIPTVVGYQSPCTSSTTTAKFSYDVAVAEQQGRGEADIAVADANNLGITAGSVLYYDMERYDPPSPDTLGCRSATLAFLKGWTDRLHELGFISGVYGSPFNANPDWVNLPIASRMDAIWMARWDNVPSVWTYVSFPTFPTNVWNNHQRIKQWRAPHDETWGGTTFNIDGNIADGPVSGLAIHKNRRADFDGDRKADISVFRPDTGVWYVQKSNGSGYIIVAFGLSTDTPTPGDYDGDGKTDQAVFRSSDNTWHLLTKAAVYSARQFGTAGDIPAPGDFNGDGRTDVAVYRPSTGVWYIANSDSQATFTIVQFGLNGDLPVVGNYDGDGKDDIAVWRPSTGVWYVLRSSDLGVTAVAFGISTDRPAQGDYDGDGRTDPGVYRDGTWYLLQSTVGYGQFNFGLAGDVPATGDFDGDGRDDAAVFRPSNGIWYLLQSTNGFYAQQFGLTGDKPVPAAYLPQ